ncbi:hypothetical protein O9993_16585 [Vibrio lentus]|nr:hypothetical protein [Vibrio lentus]
MIENGDDYEKFSGLSIASMSLCCLAVIRWTRCLTVVVPKVDQWDYVVAHVCDSRKGQPRLQSYAAQTLTLRATEGTYIKAAEFAHSEGTQNWSNLFLPMVV